MALSHAAVDTKAGSKNQTSGSSLRHSAEDTPPLVMGISIESPLRLSMMVTLSATRPPLLRSLLPPVPVVIPAVVSLLPSAGTHGHRAAAGRRSGLAPWYGRVGATHYPRRGRRGPYGGAAPAV